MNWIDGVVLVIVVYYAVQGFKNGAVLGLIDLTGFFLSFILALKFYTFPASFFSDKFKLSIPLANAVGFLTLGLGVQIIFAGLANFIYRFIPVRFIRSRLNNLFGILPAVGSSVLFSAFLLTLILALPMNGSIKKDISEGYLSKTLVRKTQGVEAELKRIFGDIIGKSIVFYTINPTSRERINLNFKQRKVSIDLKSEQRMLNLINLERKSRGIPLLTVDDNLKNLARNYAKKMLAEGFFSHYSPQGDSPFERMEMAAIKFSAAGENLAFAPDVTLAHQGLMNSPGHRANILSRDFHKAGIAAIDAGIFGIMFVQEFTD